jgi:CTP:molybdopterin cytidylyltransferase MocA
MGERCTALVLAAGKGRRMGAPKALLERGGAPLVQLHVERALALRCTRALVIVRPALATAVEALFARAPYADHVRVLAAATPSQAASLAVLVRSLACDALAPDLTFLVAPVDTLPCSAATFRALRAALANHSLAATPCFGARGGHPVLLRAALLEAYLHGPLDGCRSLRDVLAGAGRRRMRVDVADAHVIADLDTPADARALGLQLPPAYRMEG